MALANYNELVADIRKYAKRSALPDVDRLVLLAEMRIRYGSGAFGDAYYTPPVRITDMITDDVLTIAQGDTYVILPADFLGFADDLYLDDACHSQLTATAQSNRFLRAYHAQAQKPAEYAIVGRQLKFSAPSDAGYDLPVSYYALAALGPDNLVNPLLLARPDIYLWGALLEVDIYNKNAESASQHLDLFRSAVSSAQAFEEERAFTGAIIAVSDGATP